MSASTFLSAGLLVAFSFGSIAPTALAGASRPFPGAGRSTAEPFPSSQPPILVQNAPAIIPAGTTLPVRYDEAERILVTPEETIPLTLQVAANIRDRNGLLLIPFGSEIVGEIRPVESGAQFIARTIVINGRSQPLRASSDIVTRTETVRRGASTGDVLEGAAIGAAAATVLAEVTGGIQAIEVLGGAGLGALGGFLLNRGDSVELIVIEPNTDLAVFIDAPLTVQP